VSPDRKQLTLNIITRRGEPIAADMAHTAPPNPAPNARGGHRAALAREHGGKLPDHPLARADDRDMILRAAAHADALVAGKWPVRWAGFDRRDVFRKRERAAGVLRTHRVRGQAGGIDDRTYAQAATLAHWDRAALER
jgi:hypothetical protein